ncbi:MAG: hypothetical protein ACRC3K_09200, partial [Plesiomonas sp.]
MMNKWFKHIGLAIALLFSAVCLANGGDELANQVQQSDAQIWAQLKDGVQGYTASKSEFHAQPINTYDLRALELRSDWLAPALMAALFGMIIIFVLFIKVNG